MFQPDPANVRMPRPNQTHVAYDLIFKAISKVTVLIHSELFDYSHLLDN